MDLVNCIDRIPNSLNKIIETYGNDVKILNRENISVINIIGSGTSHTAGELAKYFIEKYTNIRCRVEFPKLFLNNFTKEKINKDEVFIFVSQGGYTKVVYESLLKVKKSGFKTIAISENGDSPIAESSDIFFNMMTDGEEFVFRTLGYTCTAVILSLIGLNLGNKNIKPFIDDLENVITNLPLIKQTSYEWFHNNGKKFIESDSFIFIGSEMLYYLAKECEIKFMEMVPIMSNSYELEESIHGPQNCFNDKMSFFILDKDEKEKSEALEKFLIKEITSKAVDLGLIDCVGKYYYFVEYAYFMQYLVYNFAKLKGRDLNVRLNSQIDQYISKLL